ncbi:MAG: hypothetical protein HOB73_16460 [Planctomycetaceae bacterium]|jgi:hypothetical protein|nr:hypothetical protein [Planctomycetaceae bacterium]
MKIPRIILSLAGVALLTTMLGCNDLGVQLAKMLPENEGSSAASGQLNEAGDTQAIDPSQIGGGNSSMSQLDSNDGGGMNGFVDGPMDEDYSEMMENFGDDMAMDGMEDGGAVMGLDDEKQMLQLDDPTDGFEGGADSDMTAQMNSLEPAISGGDDDGPGYLESLGGAMAGPPLDGFGGEQSRDGFGGRVGGMEKPTNGRGPQKQRRPNGNDASQRPSSNSGIPNIRDRPTKANANPSVGVSSNSQTPTMQSKTQNRGGGKPSSKPNVPANGIAVPGKIVNPIYSLLNSVAVPILLTNGTGMSFSSEMKQQRELTSRGTVYWVVHSQKLGLIRFAVSPRGGRLSGVGSKFTPTSGPFKAFIVAIESDGAVKYLSSAVDIQWNP